MKNVEQNNILIARFLGYELWKSERGKTPETQYITVGESPNDKNYRVEMLPFHCDWNWLMQVVEKIETLEFKGLTFTVDILRRDTQVNYYGYVEINNMPFDLGSALLHSERTTKIEATYNACIEFINWYNINS